MPSHSPFDPSPMAAITSRSSSIADGNLAIAAGSQTFTCFSNLPIELRNIVWAYAANQPRNVDIWAPTIGSLALQWNSQLEEEDFKAFKYYTRRPVPSVLHASRESRSNALMFYQLSFGMSHDFERDDGITISIPPKIYCNIRADRICPMGHWDFDAHWDFWRENPPSSFAVNIRDTKALRIIREAWDIVPDDPDDSDDSDTPHVFDEVYLYSCEDLSLSGSIDFTELSEATTTKTEWASLRQERDLLLRKIEHFQEIEKGRIRERYREKGDKLPRDPAATWCTASTIELMAIVVDGVRH